MAYCGYIDAALVHKTRGRRDDHSSIEQCIPADLQVVRAWSLIPKIAVRRESPPRVVLRPYYHVDAPVDRQIHLFAECVAADRRAHAHDRYQKTALSARLAYRMPQIGQIKDGHSKELEERV